MQAYIIYKLSTGNVIQLYFLHKQVIIITTDTDTHALTNTHICAYMHTHTYIQVHIHTHTHKHTPSFFPSILLCTAGKFMYCQCFKTICHNAPFVHTLTHANTHTCMHMYARHHMRTHMTTPPLQGLPHSNKRLLIVSDPLLLYNMMS